MKTTSSTSSSINVTATSSKRMSGLVSGLDTDTIVKQMSAGTQNKIDKQMQSKQIALWRQASYREVTTALTQFKNKYYSTSSSSSNISSPSFFNSTSIKNTSTFLNISGNTSVAKNMVVTKISQLAKQASFSSNHKVSNGAITTGIISPTFAKNLVPNASMTITSGGKDYTVGLSNDFVFNSTDPAANIADLAANLNSQISKIDGLKGIVTFGTDGKIAVTGPDVTIKDGNATLLKGLGLTKETSYSSTSSVTTDAASLFTTAVLADTLSGSTLSFSLDGVSKNIKFDETRKSEYSDAAGLKTYLQNSLDAVFGTNNVHVTDDAGKLSFTTPNSSTSIVSINSCDKSGILGIGGALRTYAGETNRINTNKTLEDIQSSLNGTLTLDSYAPAKTTGPFDAYAPPKTTGDFDAYAPAKTTGPFDAYGLTINGKKFAFKSTATIADIISTVNNDNDANVTLAYSNTTNSFSVTADNGGSSGKVDIASSGLADALFGSSGTDYTVQVGTNAELKVSFDGDPAHAVDIVRTDNKFTLDGVNFELLNKSANADGTLDTPIKFTVDNKTDDLYTKIKGFVDDYNALIEMANSKVSESKPTDGVYAPLTDALKESMTETEVKNWEIKAKKGLMKGDSILNNLSLNLRHSMTDTVASMKSALYEIGIASKANDYSANGKLTIDEDKLKNALTNDPDKISSLFTGTDGIAARMQDVINKNIKTTGGDGILIEKAGIESAAVDKSSLNQSITTYNAKIKDLKKLLATQQEQYYAKFTKLEQYLSRMNSQASMFTTGTSS